MGIFCAIRLAFWRGRGVLTSAAAAAALAVGCCAAGAAGKEPVMRATLVDSLEPLYADSNAAETGAATAALHVARGGTAAVHALIHDVPLKAELHFAARAAGRAVPDATWFRLVDVPVEVNTGPRAFIETKGQKNPHVIRRAPFRVYDAMAPAASPLASPGGTVALRLEIPIARTARPGQRSYTLRVRCGDRACDLGLSVTVHKAIVPPVGKDSLPYTNWFSLTNMATRHGLKPWSEAHWKMVARYAKLMARGRQNTFWLPWGDIFRREKTQRVLDRVRLRRIVRTFTEAGMYYIEGGHVAHRTGGKWDAPSFDVSMGGPRATTVAGNAALARALKPLREEIERNGWRERWIQHVTDEPIAANAADYRILVGMVRKYLPGVPILDATMDTTLAGAVDIWCPQCQEYQKHRKHFEAQRALGDRVWFYTCCSPGGPWLNRLLDMELLRPALFGWAMARYDLDGFLHWGLNQYRADQDPFQKSVVPHSGGNSLPAGDTHVIYPGKDGPWSSLRFEAQREGFEDYELLERLKAARPKDAERILAKALRAFDDYTKDVKVFRQARRSLLEALDR
jgi:hypothetical protein